MVGAGVWFHESLSPTPMRRAVRTQPTSQNLLLTSLAAVMAVVSACTFEPTADPESVGQAGSAFDEVAEQATVERAIHGTIGWAQTKDFDLLYGIIAPDSAYLEVHPGDRVVKGFAEFRQAEDFWGNPDFRAIRYEIKELRITFSRSGDVAWFFCMLDDENEWRGEPASWLNARWTGVLEKREGRWRMVQMHFSNAVEE